MIMVHCGCSYTSSPIHTVEMDMHIIKHNHSMLEGKKTLKKQPQQQKQEKTQLTLTFKICKNRVKFFYCNF